MQTNQAQAGTAGSDTPEISVILCTYNRAGTLQITLESLAHQAVPAGLRWELLVIDNNSRDNTRSVVEAWIAKSQLPLQYVFEQRQGKSFALNTGIERARGAILAFTDDDVTLDPGWLAAIADAFRRFDCIGIGGRIRPAWRTDPPRWFNATGPYALMQAIVHFELGAEPKRIRIPVFGANMAFRREAFEKYGKFRTDLGPKGNTHTIGEDTDICTKVFNGGDVLYYVPGALVDHPVEPERTNKGYFLHWYVQFGRITTRKGLPAGSRWLGVPPYLVRELLTSGVRWFTTFDDTRRFFHKLRTYELFGAANEAYRLARSTGSTRQVAGSEVKK